MNKAKIKAAVYSLIIVGASVFAFLTYQKIQHRNLIRKKILQLKPLSLLDIDSTKYIYSTSKYKYNTSGKVVIILFNSTCEHCLAEIEDIKKHIESFRSTDVLLVSTESPAEIRSFAEQSGLSGFPNFHFANISFDDLYERFGVASYPHIFIYDTDKNLVKEFKGETKVDAILQVL